MDIYTDMQTIIEDCEADIPKFIKEVHPYDSTDAKMLMEMFREEIDFQDEEREAERSDKVKCYDYSDVEELVDIDEWYLGEGE